MIILIEGRGTVFDKLYYHFLIVKLLVKWNRISISLISCVELSTLGQLFSIKQGAKQGFPSSPLLHSAILGNTIKPENKIM